MSVITDRHMQRKPAERDTWLTEDAPRGHGRFQARITRSGERLFYFRYTTSDGERVTLPLGAYDPSGTSGLTLAEARRSAGELSRLYQSGITNLKEHLANEELLRQSRQAAEQARLDEEREAARILAEAHARRATVRDLFERWLTIDLVRHRDRGKEVRRMFEKDVLPLLGQMAVEDIRKVHVTTVTDALLARGVPRMAKVIFSLIRQMFRFAVDRDIIEFDPTSGIRKAKIGGKDVERERVLSDNEILLLSQRLPLAGLTNQTQQAVWLCLSTCCRIGELLAARWKDIDLDASAWWIPPEHSKNGKAHTIFLSEFAAGRIRALRDIGLSAARAKSPSGSLVETTAWLFPNRSWSGPVNPKSITKQLVDRQRLGRKPMKGRASERFAETLVLPGGRWTPHDLRRTGATLMVRLGTLPEVAERCLNHAEENRVKRIYQRHGYEREMAEAWHLVGKHLEGIVEFRAIA